MNGYPSLNPFQVNTQQLCEKITDVNIILKLAKRIIR